MSLHGVGLSPGSTDPLDTGHLARLKQLVGRVEPALVTEHLTWSSCGGVFLNALLPLPRTVEAVAHIAGRIGRVQDTLGRQILDGRRGEVASLQFGRCEGFERRADAPAAEQAYADYLLGRLDPARIALLPAAQQPLATPAREANADLATLQSVEEPQSRLLGAALWLQSSRATPEVLALTVDTASARGWRRPLVAWLAVQQRRAEQAGDREEAARLARRIELVLGWPPPR